MPNVRPELQARFGNDPDALEWARGHVQGIVDWLDEAAALPQAGPEFVRVANWAASIIRDTLIGTPGERGTYGAFDARFAPAANAEVGDG